MSLYTLYHLRKILWLIALVWVGIQVVDRGLRIIPNQVENVRILKKDKFQTKEYTLYILETDKGFMYKQADVGSLLDHKLADFIQYASKQETYTAEVNGMWTDMEIISLHPAIKPKPIIPKTLTYK